MKPLTPFRAQLTRLAPPPPPPPNAPPILSVLRKHPVLLCLLLALVALFLSPFGALTTRAATITVNSTCSLDNAIKSANTNTATGGCTAGDSSGRDIINLTANITLSANLTTISSTVTINGNGFFVSGNNARRILHVNSSGDLRLENIDLKNGNIAGFGNHGAIVYNQGGTLTVINSLLRDAFSDSAIHSTGTSYIGNSTLFGNSTDAIGNYGTDIHVSGGTTRWCM